MSRARSSDGRYWGNSLGKRVLLVEPAYRSSYPPLGLMKIAAYHRQLGDKIEFVRGESAGHATQYWDRVYITSLFTYDWGKVVSTIHFYKDNLFGASAGRIYAGGIAASLLPDNLYAETGVYPIIGRLTSARQLGDDSDINIDLLAPDYSILDQTPHSYRYGRAYIAHATRGCIRTCPFCAVPILEPKYQRYIDLVAAISAMRDQIGDRPELILMDNNVLASASLERIVKDLVDLGFAKGEHCGKQARVVDFNQGLDARLVTPRTSGLLAQLPLKPVRIAYDRASDGGVFEKAVRLVAEAGFTDVSNYLLYNFDDHPKDLWLRMHHCVELSERLGIRLWSFPMRFAPITDTRRGHVGSHWNKRLLRGVQCVSLVTRGIVSHRHDFFHKAFGDSVDEFLEILSMPDRYIIQRASHENNGAAEWKRGFCALGQDGRHELWKLASATSQEGLRSNLETASPGPVRDLLAHYIHERTL